ncbi:hypothetical protein HPP92_001608 [Vanilla planifolia]|uniref:Uncharacterized protein n=1 Tax=Vanilla planifolia TaxID=51239 RepID=A0A835VHE9_VANPL|nr:hypothetical protein HPP92_001831 [Vanilla planifolia]KAG0501536.1 hypothetical protein HPP92_001608 [Vanilla planifolia]
MMASVVSSLHHPHTVLLRFSISSAPPIRNPSFPPSLQGRKLLRSPLPSLSVSISDFQGILPRAINLSAGSPSDPAGKLGFDDFINLARKLLDDLPQPVKSFPWGRALERFFHIIFSLVCTVAKYLSVPLLAISSLSEMSYCGHERKLTVVPFPFVIGFVMADVLSRTVIDLSPKLQEEECPWHLLVAAISFILLKLPGPYYPYWGRLLIPHFANGGLWKTVFAHVFVVQRIGRKNCGEATIFN